MPAADRATALSDAKALSAGGEAEDRARAETMVPLDADALFDFVRDVERLYRLNPHVEFRSWQVTGSGFRMQVHNEISERMVETDAAVEVTEATRSIGIRYGAGLKRATTIEVEGCGPRAKLVVTEHYPVIADPEDPRLADADRSLAPWVNAVHLHLGRRARWGWIPGWRWWSERFLPGLPPRQRRIVRMIVWASLFEFLLFVALVAILVVAE